MLSSSIGPVETYKREKEKTTDKSISHSPLLFKVIASWTHADRYTHRVIAPNHWFNITNKFVDPYTRVYRYSLTHYWREFFFSLLLLLFGSHSTIPVPLSVQLVDSRQNQHVYLALNHWTIHSPMKTTARMVMYVLKLEHFSFWSTDSNKMFRVSSSKLFLFPCLTHSFLIRDSSLLNWTILTKMLFSTEIHV